MADFRAFRNRPIPISDPELELLNEDLQPEIPYDFDLTGSWVHMRSFPGSGFTSGTNSGNRTPETLPPLPFSLGSGPGYMLDLRDAQRESKDSSRVPSHRSTPKSPPNTPTHELETNMAMRDAFRTAFNFTSVPREWTSGVEFSQKEMQGWKAGPNNKGYSLRTKKLGNMSLFTKEIVYSFLISNVLTFIIGAGIGVWLSKRGYTLA